LKVSFDSIYCAQQVTLSDLKSLYCQFEFCKNVLKIALLSHSYHPIATLLDILSATFRPSLSFPLIKIVAEFVLVTGFASLE